MAEASSKASIVAPITCGNEDCDSYGDLINAVLLPAADEDTFYEGFGQGAESDSDWCLACKELGLLEDPVPAAKDSAPHIPNCLSVLDAKYMCTCSTGKKK